MASTNHLAYDLIAQQHKLPLLCQAWWWDAVCIGKGWDVLMVYDDNGQPIGALPYHILHRFAFNVIVMPPRTQRTFLWIHPDADPQNVLERMYEELQQIQRRHRVLFMYLQLALTDEQAAFFQKHGYTVNQRVTYCIDLSIDKETLWNRFSENKRRQIKRAEKICHLSELDADAFYQFHVDTLRQRGREIEYSLNVWRSIYHATTSRSQGKILAATDQHGNVLAAIFLIWDSERCYSLLPVYSPEHKNSGAMAWLTKESIRFAYTVSKTYDFEGSMDPGIANSYRQYASAPQTYYSISRRDWIKDIAQHIVQLIKSFHS